MQRDLARIIQQTALPPEMGMVTVSAVEVTRDLSLAKVFISILGNQISEKDVLSRLQKDSGRFRYKLGQRMRLRSVPELRFMYDDSVVRGNRLADLINRANSSTDTDEENQD